MIHSEIRNCETCKNDFTLEVDDFALYEKIGIPASDKCPRCRWQHLAAFWNYGRFRKTQSALSGKTIITTFPETVKFPLYEHTEFVGDGWDPMQYGKEYDPSRPFFDQYKELQQSVPHPHQLGSKNVNCQWSDDVWSSKECYLCRSLFECEDVSYGYRIIHCKNSIDITYCFDIELSYDCLYCFKCYKVRHSYDARDCMESMFLFDCRNVSNCFMSWNLRNKQYHILNKPYTKEEYFKKLQEFDTQSWSGIAKLKKEFQKILREEAVHRANQNVQVTNVHGNFLAECKNCTDAYFVEKSENSRHVFRGFGQKETIDCVGGGFVEKSALANVGLYIYDSVVTSHSLNCRYSAYLDFCEECEYCFGCVGLRKKKYCILNKQYTEEEYTKIVAKIKENMKKKREWGKFFPIEMAYAGYNLSVANIFFPETKEGIEAMGGRWDEVEIAEYDAMSGNALPERIDEIKDEITTKRIKCPKTQLSFNIAPQELAFYREHHIPPPREHFDWRTEERFRPLVLSMHPQRGTCVFCKREVEHFYSPELGYQKIACVECYQREMV